MITQDEFIKQASSGIRKRLSEFPIDKVEKYIESLQEDMKKVYMDSLELTGHLGTNQVDPSSYAYGAMMSFE